MDLFDGWGTRNCLGSQSRKAGAGQIKDGLCKHEKEFEPCHELSQQTWGVGEGSGYRGQRAPTAYLSSGVSLGPPTILETTSVLPTYALCSVSAEEE